MWCIPPEQNADFVAKMEDILDVYTSPYDENCPVICLDEKPYQLLGEVREPIPMKTGNPQKIDNEYERMGTCSIFVMCEPLKGWHHANARERRTAVDFAHEIDWLLSESPYRNAPKIKLVQDNLILICNKKRTMICEDYCCHVMRKSRRNALCISRFFRAAWRQKDRKESALFIAD